MARGSPGPWTVYYEVFRPQLGDAKVIEVQDAAGRPVIPWTGFDDCEQPITLRLANAYKIAAVPSLLAFARRVAAESTQPTLQRAAERVIALSKVPTEARP